MEVKLDRTQMEQALLNIYKNALEAIALPFEIMPCDPSLADTAVFCEHYRIPAECSANTKMQSSGCDALPS